MTKNKPAPILKHSEEITVNFFDADPLGIVWHGNYFKYFEIARESFGKRYGISYLNIMEKGLAVPIVQTSTQHKRPLRYGDKAIVEVTFVNNPAAKLIFDYKITNGANELVCEGKTVQVFTDFKTSELQLNIPEFFREWKRKHGL